VSPLTTEVDGPDAPQAGPVSKHRRTVSDYECLTARHEAVILRAVITSWPFIHCFVATSTS
jgi:hypothetical protein